MEFNKYIDHTLLAPDATEEQIDTVIKQAIDNHFHTVMVNPYWVAKVHQALEGTDVVTACVIGFPLGANTTKIKVAEAEDAIDNGVDELDMVMNIGEMSPSTTTRWKLTFRPLLMLATRRARSLRSSSKPAC